MFIGVNEVVIRRIIQEDKTNSDGKSTNSRPNPGESWITGPGEEEEPNGYDPAGTHHRDETNFSRGFAVVFITELQVVLIDERCAKC